MNLPFPRVSYEKLPGSSGVSYRFRRGLGDSPEGTDASSPNPPPAAPSGTNPKDTTVSEAIELLKANLPAHPPVEAIKPLEEDYTGLRILAVHAHPDDESSKGAGTASA